jgi:hypothetical protein
MVAWCHGAMVADHRSQDLPMTWKAMLVAW